GYDPEEFLINYNEKFKQSDFALFRDEVIDQTIATLIKKAKPNALLIGPAGVGKTKIVEDIAMRLATGHKSIPDQLADKTIYELPLSNLVAGSGIVGQLEDKIKSVLDFAENPENNVILFIDEIHQIVGESPIYDKIAQILKPALARGDCKVIGATTTQEATNLTRDPAFNRRFSRVIVDELTNDQTVKILDKYTGTLSQHYTTKNLTMQIDDKILPTIVNIANQFSAAGQHRPDTALTLLDDACSDTIITRRRQEQLAAEQKDDTVLKALKATKYVAVTERQIRKTAIRNATGHSKKEHIDETSLREKLSKIKGQNEILDVIIQKLLRDDKGLYPRVKPLTFLFAGASGVGKTEVTKIIADEITGTKPITIDMTEFHSS
ncbi:MAG: ATP-dependent Clp protease ATP-binding subunit, partial [Streptococcus gallolyticus]|nr:ATP-dependent Clp protease ATP-binding subunit [Streptococcus gallolyticus]